MARGDNPYADEKPLYTITASNLDQYSDLLSEGHKALFRTFPKTYKMKIYPSHRSASYPDWLYQATIGNATKVELTDNGFLEKEKARRAQKRQQRLEEAGGADGGSRDEGAGAAAAAEPGVEVRRAGAGEGGEALPAPKARRGDGTSAGEDAAPAVTQRERRAPSAAGSKKERKRTGKVDKKA